MQVLAQQDAGLPCSLTTTEMAALTQRLSEVSWEMHVLACFGKSACFCPVSHRYVRPAAARTAGFQGETVLVTAALTQRPCAVSWDMHVLAWCRESRVVICRAAVCLLQCPPSSYL